ncbi:hypothetical protein O9Z70_10530 [Devosia sp. YIM 151766]|nr:hypothetical protein [Devosia sp. YIM 151766]WIY51917.1 hypothetical protein O9Z70_10530 [Devosia sp. YIM 151766]
MARVKAGLQIFFTALAISVLTFAATFAEVPRSQYLPAAVAAE